MTNKPKWVEVADKAGKALERAVGHTGDEKQDFINEAYAWMKLAEFYKDSPRRSDESNSETLLLELVAEIEKVRSLHRDDQYVGAQDLAELTDRYLMQIGHIG